SWCRLCIWSDTRSHLSLCCSFTPPARPEIYTLSLHDALPIWSDRTRRDRFRPSPFPCLRASCPGMRIGPAPLRSRRCSLRLDEGAAPQSSGGPCERIHNAPLSISCRTAPHYRRLGETPLIRRLGDR